jgi:hypothetical protein
MAPVTVYLDKETKEKIRAAAKAKNISVSQWVANLIRENLQPRWPDDVAALAGAWPDFLSLEEIRGENHPNTTRESI